MQCHQLLTRAPSKPTVVCSWMGEACEPQATTVAAPVVASQAFHCVWGSLSTAEAAALSRRSSWEEVYSTISSVWLLLPTDKSTLPTVSQPPKLCPWLHQPWALP